MLMLKYIYVCGCIHICSYMLIYACTFRLGDVLTLVGMDIRLWDYIENKFHQWSLHEDHEKVLLSRLQGSEVV